MKKKISAFLLLVLALGCIVMGIRQGEIRIILMKAVNICLECIGVG